jgi:recombination protein RecT
MKSEEVVKRFEELLGEKNARPYIQSVIIAVSASPQLQKCSPESILRSALRAASLGLSCDPAVKQAWLVPFYNGQKQAYEAQFIAHYKGLHALAMRTGKYWNINVSPVYEGQRVLEDPRTGMHVVQEQNGFIADNPAKSLVNYIDVTNRRKSDRRIIGWLGYFKMKNGFEKSLYMSVGEIEDHARKYVKEYEKNPNWSDKEKREVMEKKTVLRQLLSWADLSGTENAQLVQALSADADADAEIIEDDSERKNAQAEDKPITYEDAEKIIIETKRGQRFLTELDPESLNELYLQTEDERLREAIKIVLKSDYNMDAPTEQKKDTKKTLKELGFE